MGDAEGSDCTACIVGSRDGNGTVLVILACLSPALSLSLELGNNVWLLITKFPIISKLGVPKPVTASQPGTAEKPTLQQLAVSIEPPTPHAFISW